MINPLEQSSNPLFNDSKKLDTSTQSESNLDPTTQAISDRGSSINNERLTQSAAQDGEVSPEFGDAADPTSEELGLHHRDE